jgi:hypothetical protein
MSNLEALRATLDVRAAEWWQRASDREIRAARASIVEKYHKPSDEFVRVKMLNLFDAAWASELRRRDRLARTQGGQLRLFAGGA